MAAAQSGNSQGFSFVADAEASGHRLDRWLTNQLPEQSRSTIQRWIEGGQVLVNNQASKPGYRLEPGDAVAGQPPPAAAVSSLQPLALPLAVVYEDDDLLVIDKPAGLVVHPAPGHHADTLVNALLYHRPELEAIDDEVGSGATPRPGIVHRLDKETSGLIVVAKQEAAQRFLQAQFKARTVYKEYVALVEGRLTPPAAQIVAPIGRHPHDRLRMAILPPDPRTGEQRGRTAITEYHVLGYYAARVRSDAGQANFSLVRVIIHTGRTHQIRVHLAWRKHPVVGDLLYGHRQPPWPNARQFLHAHRLHFILPSTGQLREFVAPLPEDLQQVLDRLEEQG